MASQRHQRGLRGAAPFVMSLLGLTILAIANSHLSPALHSSQVAASQENLPGIWMTYANADAIRALVVQGNYLWAGTHLGGLVRWKISDKTYTQYLYPQTGLPSNDVRSIDVDAQERVWIATDRGLAVLVDDAITAYRKANSGLPADNVTDVEVASDGKVWIGTDGGGVVVLDDGGTTGDPSDDRWTIYADELLSPHITAVEFDGVGHVWIGTRPYPNPHPEGPELVGGGVCVFDGQSFFCYTAENSPLISNYVLTVCPGSGDEMWVTTQGGGIVRFHAQGSDDFTRTAGLLGTRILSCVRDTEGRIWFATPLRGVVMFDGVNWVNYRAQTSPLMSDLIYTVTSDTAGRVWFGAQDFTGGPQGISLVDGSTWDEYVTVEQGVASNHITDIAFRADGSVWVATDRGVSVLRDGSWTTYTRANTRGELASDHVRSIAIAEDGQVWLGTIPFIASGQWGGGGVSVFDPVTGSWTTYDKDTTGETGLEDNWVQKVALDTTGRVWMGTGTPPGVAASPRGTGLTVYDQGTWTTYTSDFSREEFGAPSNRIADIAFDDLGRIWLAALPDASSIEGTGGVARLDLGDNGVPDPPYAGDDSWTFWTNWNSGLHLGPEDGWGGVQVIHVRADEVWAGGWLLAWVSAPPRRGSLHGSLNHFIEAHWTWVDYPFLRHSGAVTSLVSDQNGLWVGTEWGGAGYITDQGIQTVITTDAYPVVSNDITVIRVDPQGGVWFGTADGGISHYRPPAAAPQQFRLVLPIVLKPKTDFSDTSSQ